MTSFKFSLTKSIVVQVEVYDDIIELTMFDEDEEQSKIEIIPEAFESFINMLYKVNSFVQDEEREFFEVERKLKESINK